MLALQSPSVGLRAHRIQAGGSDQLKRGFNRFRLVVIYLRRLLRHDEARGEFRIAGRYPGRAGVGVG